MVKTVVELIEANTDMSSILDTNHHLAIFCTVTVIGSVSVKQKEN
jgi:hypothetical protein